MQKAFLAWLSFRRPTADDARLPTVSEVFRRVRENLSVSRVVLGLFLFDSFLEGLVYK